MSLVIIFISNNLTCYVYLLEEMSGYQQEIDADDFSRGYSLFNTEKNSKSLRFIAMYVSLIYSKGGTKQWLKDHPSKTLLHMITPSDIAYVIALLKNSQTAWTGTPVDEQKKALFTSGDNKKRQFGATNWNEEGMGYYNTCLSFWTAAFKNKDLWEQLLNDWNEYIQGSTTCKHLRHKQEQDTSKEEVTTEVVARVAPKYYFGLDGEEDDHLRVSTYVFDYFHELNL